MNSSRPSRPLRHWLVRCGLALLLIPLAVAAISLARIPGTMTTYAISDDGGFVLTGTHSPIDDERADYRLLSLQTGRTREFHAEYAEFAAATLQWTERDDAGWVHLKSLDLASFHETTLGKSNRKGFVDPCISFIVPGLLATLNERNELCVIDVRTGRVASAPLPPIPGTPFHFWMPLWRGTPSRLLAREVSNGMTKGRERMLMFSYTHGRLEKLSEWTAQALPRLAAERLVSLTADHQLEFRRLSDGVLVESQSLGDTLKIPAGASAWVGEFEPPWFSIPVSPNRQIIYDYERRQVVLERYTANGRVVDLCADAVIFNMWSQSEPMIEVVRLQDEKLITRITFPLPVYSAQFTPDGTQVLILLQDESVHLYDVASGRRVRTWRSRVWVVPTFVALLVGFAMWCGLWVRLGVRAGWHPLWDVAVVNGLILAGLLLRVFWQGSLRDPGRPVYPYCEALAASWLMLATLWLVFGRARWSIRVLMPVLGLTTVLALAMVLFRGDRQVLVGILAGASGGTALMTIPWWLARRWGWQLTDGRGSTSPPDVPRVSSQLPLRDLFFLVAAVAALLAFARFVPRPRGDLQAAKFVGLTVCVIAGSAICGAWGALSPRHWLVRLVVATALVVGLGSMHSLILPQFANWPAWLQQVRLMAMPALFTAASLLIFRTRGWRFAHSMSPAAP